MKKNDFNKIMIAMFTAFMICLMSFLTAFGCFKSIQQEDNIATASIVEEDYDVSSNDTDYVNFRGSNISFYRYVNNNWRTIFGEISLRQSSTYSWSLDFLLTLFGDSVAYYYGSSSTSDIIRSQTFSTNSTSWILGSSSNGIQFYSFNITNGQYSSTYNIYVRAWYYSNSTTPLGSIIGFDYGMYGLSWQTLPSWYLLDGGVNTVISYFDTFGNRLCFSVAINTDKYVGYDSLPPRTYYFSNTDSDSYQAGYNIGFSDGSSDGYDNGFSDGSSVGYNNGYNVGYTAGENANNPYTFLALLTAVVDAPVQVFSNLFDWNFLGFNLKNFFLSLITICVILIILKYVLGGAGGD